MTRNTIHFEREKLYEEVWAEPVTKVAMRYGLSDVGLKKICKKLSVPTPPLGYWARLQHGKKPPRTALPKLTGPTVYQHTKRIPYVSEELAKRMAIAKPSIAVSVPNQIIKVNTRLEDFHPLIRQLSKELKGKSRDSRDWPVTSPQGALVLAVSLAHANRALSTADLALRYCLDAKYRLAKSDAGVAYIDVNGEHFRLRISEKSLRVERQPTLQEKDYARRYPTIYGNRAYYTSTPTGMMRLDVLRADRSYPLCSFRDGKSKSLEDLLPALISKLQDLALEATVQKQLNRESKQRREIRRAEQARLDEIRDLALQKLEEIEKAAAAWGRAERLRAFAKVLEAADGVEDKGLVAWTLRAADWVDPLVQGAWPEVDDAQAHELQDSDD